MPVGNKKIDKTDKTIINRGIARKPAPIDMPTKQNAIGKNPIITGIIAVTAPKIKNIVLPTSDMAGEKNAKSE